MQTINKEENMTIKDLFNKYGSADIYEYGYKYKGKYIRHISYINNCYKVTTMPISYSSFIKSAENKLLLEIKQGVQCLNFQCFTIWSSNGQTPFVTFFMYLNEAKSEQEKHDLALIIEEILKQRIQGVKNNQGVWVSPAFPKLIYVLEEDNCSEGTKYWPLTELAAKYTAKRLVPDYISVKKMM